MILFIKKIEMCEAYHVHAVADVNASKVFIADFVPWQKIDIIDFASLQIVDDLSRTQRFYEVKVQARLAERFPLPTRPVVFRLTSIFNQTYLLGVPHLCPPFPTVKMEDRIPAKPSDERGCTLSVSLKSAYLMPEISE